MKRGLFCIGFVLLIGVMSIGTGYAVNAHPKPKAQVPSEIANWVDENDRLASTILDWKGSSNSTHAWPMVAANPQRTSWNAEEIRGDLNVDWYRPIEPFIHYKVQPIAANGKVYVSTARGLYAFSADNGDLLWVYPTELPLGHSPTIATIGDRHIAFVGGYDRIIHAVDATSGEPIAGYDPFEADAGFETNPLVVDDTIYAGNRDGYFYALSAINGDLKWRFSTNGPILYSAAFKDDVVFFASNDAHAYALNTTDGSLLWVSEKLPGSGFHSYWPVVYSDVGSGRDYVAFTGGENYLGRVLDLIDEESSTLFGSIPVDELIGPASTAIPGDWVQGTLVMDASVITNYYQNQPERRTVFVLDAATGEEHTFDANGDGLPEYAPFLWSGVTSSGSKYPPVVNGVDGVYYQGTSYYSFGWRSRGGPTGWKLGTPYISRVHTDIGHASDEPMAYSSGGSLVYWNLCCDREAGAFDVTIPFDQPNRDWFYFGYNLASNNLAPGYQQMYFSGDTLNDNNGDGWQLYSGKDQSKNGVYGKHGTSQSPPIPYQGRLYMLKGNALLAFSPDGDNPQTQLALAETVSVENTSSSPTKAILAQRLEAEIQKILAAGHLRPGYHTASALDLYGSGQHTDDLEFGELSDYFQNPADTVYTLLLAYPHLSSAIQQQVNVYLQDYYGPDSDYDITEIVHIGWGTGAAREVFDIPQEVQNSWGQPYVSPSEPSMQPICGVCGYWESFPPFSFYAAWRYAVVIGGSDPELAKDLFDRMSMKLEPPLSDNKFVNKPYWLNQYIAGYQGYLELQQLAGYPQDQNVLALYEQMLDLRVTTFSKDTPYAQSLCCGESWAYSYNNALAIARNFMFLTPELADYLSRQIYVQVQEAVSEYESVAPYWFVTKFDQSYGEGTFHHLYDYPAIFQAKALILRQPYNELAKWIDVPAFSQGDLFHIQNLVFALETNQPSIYLPSLWNNNGPLVIQEASAAR